MKKVLFPIISDEAATRQWRKQLCIASSAGSAISVIVLTILALFLFPSICSEPIKIGIWICVALILVACSTYYFWFSSNKIFPAMLVRMQSIRRFLQDAGHELATPVAMLKSRVQLMERENVSDEKAANHLEVLNESIARLIELIADMRALARAETPLGASDLTLINFGSEVRSLCSQMKADCDSREITMNLNIEKAPATIIGDSDGVARVISNLLSNSIRYGRPGGTIDVAVQQSKQTVVFIVQDDGIGISPDAIPKVFDRFYREERIETKNAQGSGLGLAIVKAVVESHSGTIDVESEPGKFTRFTIEFPKTPVHPLARMMKGNM